MKITRKMVNRIYAGYKGGAFYGWLDNAREIMNYLYTEIADKELDEDDDKVRAIIGTLNYLEDKSEIGPVFTYPEINEMLNDLLIARR